MSDAASFLDLIRRVRRGDDRAAAKLVEEYEPAIRRVVRLQMRDNRLRRVLDSSDIGQSVLASFFVRAAAGQYELETPDQLVKLLAAMARNKLAGHARKQYAQRRDQRRAAGDVDEDMLPAGGATPSQIVVTRELIAEVRRRLTPEEQRLVELRQEGHDWNEIAAQVGENAVVLRKRLSRALDRAAQELGLEEQGDV
jgi:RNA polymerase sigma-70 factor (ECF subfamily)